jgi:hypothetical protein
MRPVVAFMALVLLGSAQALPRSLKTESGTHAPAPAGPKPTQNEVLALFSDWNAALATLDPCKVRHRRGPLRAAAARAR